MEIRGSLTWRRRVLLRNDRRWVHCEDKSPSPRWFLQFPGVIWSHRRTHWEEPLADYSHSRAPPKWHKPAGYGHNEHTGGHWQVLREGLSRLGSWDSLLQSGSNWPFWGRRVQLGLPCQGRKWGRVDKSLHDPTGSGSRAPANGHRREGHSKDELQLAPVNQKR